MNDGQCCLGLGEQNGMIRAKLASDHAQVLVCDHAVSPCQVGKRRETAKLGFAIDRFDTRHPVGHGPVGEGDQLEVGDGRATADGADFAEVGRHHENSSFAGAKGGGACDVSLGAVQVVERNGGVQRPDGDSAIGRNVQSDYAQDGGGD